MLRSVVSAVYFPNLTVELNISIIKADRMAYFLTGCLDQEGNSREVRQVLSIFSSNLTCVVCLQEKIITH